MSARLVAALLVIGGLFSAPLAPPPMNRRMRRVTRHFDPKWRELRRRLRRYGLSGSAAISFTNLDAVFADNVTSKSTSSISPTGGRLLLFSVAVLDDVNIVAPTVTTSLADTTVSLAGMAPLGQTRCVFLYRLWTGASPGSGTITADWGASSMQRVMLITDQVANTLPGGENGFRSIAQVYGLGAASLSTSRTENVQSFRDGTNNANYAVWLVGSNSGVATTERSGWTKLAQPTTSGGAIGNLMTQYLVGEDSSKVTSASWTGSSHSNIIHVELRGIDSNVRPGLLSVTPLDAKTGGSATSIVSNTITPDAPRLLVVAVENRRSTNPPDTPTMSDSLGTLSWSQIATVTFDTVATPLNRLTVFVARIPEGATGTVTATATNTHTRWNINIVQVNVADISVSAAGAIVQSATNNADAATSITATLSSFANGRNGTLAFLACDTTTNASTWDPGVGFIEVQTNTGGTSGSLATEWCYTNDTTADFTRASSADLAAIALEVKEQTQDLVASPPRGLRARMALIGR